MFGLGMLSTVLKDNLVEYWERDNRAKTCSTPNSMHSSKDAKVSSYIDVRPKIV